MPEFLGKKLVVTKEELVPEFWSTYNALKMELYRYSKKQYGIKRAMTGGNGRRLLIDFDSLPKHIRNAIGDPRIPNTAIGLFYKIDGDAVEYYNEYTYPDGTYLLPNTAEELILNASVLTAIVKLEQARLNKRSSMGKNSSKGVKVSLWRDSIHFNEFLLKTGKQKHTLNTSLKRFKQQLNDFKANSYYSLIKDPKGKSKKNALKRDERLDKLLNKLFAGRYNKPTPTEVARDYEAFLNGYIEVGNKITGEIYDPKDYKPIKPRTIVAYLSKWETKIGTHAKRSGDRQTLLTKFIPYESLEAPTLAGSVISIDDRQPPFFYEEGKRMWWYIGIDLASECIVAWAFGKSKEELILNFYKNMVENHHKWGYNMPHTLECESSLNSSFKDTFLQNGAMFQEVLIYKNNARSKRIERFFKEIRYEFEKQFIGWLPRPFAKSESNQIGPDKKVIIPYEKLVEQCFHNIITWNNCPKKGTKTSRFDYYQQNQNPDLKSTNYKSFIRQLGRLTKSSCKAGLMHLQSYQWVIGDKGKIFTGEKLIKVMKQIEGKGIDIWHISDSMGRVMKAFVYDREDDRYICEAIPKPISARSSIEATLEHIVARKIMQRYIQTVDSFMRNQKNAIEDITIIDHRKKTISNSFSIDNIPTFETRNTPVEEIPTDEEELIYVPNNNRGNSFRDNFLNENL